MLIVHIDYKLHDIKGWLNPERDSDIIKDLKKCKIILIKQKIKCISKFYSCIKFVYIYSLSSARNIYI